MIKRVVFVGVGVVAGWTGARVLSKGRDVAAIKAEQALRDTFAPENLGRNAGRAAATFVAESARSFVGQIREEVPAWQSKAVTDERSTNTITGSVRENPMISGNNPNN